MNASTKGQSLIELLIVIAIMVLFLPALISGLTASREGKPQLIQREEAFSLLKEAEEGIRIVRERNWSEIAINGNYSTQINGSIYSLIPIVTTPTPSNGYTRIINISDTLRDANGKISQTGTADPSTKKISITVSWSQPYSSSVNSVIYLSRYLNNENFTETLEADFERGITSNQTAGVSTVDEEGGEVVLGEGGAQGSWCNPNLAISAVDLPKSGVANAVSAIEGQVVAGTGENASGVSFARVDISNPPAPTPPAGTINGTFDGFKTNGVFIEPNVQDFAYLTTDTNSKEVVIIDLTSQSGGKFPQAGYFNAPGNTSAKSIFVVGNIGYATVNNILYTFDLSSKSNSRDQLGQFTLAGNGNKVVVNGNYAYVAVESLTKQLQIIQVSTDGETLTEAGWAALDGSYGRDVFVNTAASRAYVATAQSADKHEMFVIDISTKTGSRPTVATYETNGMDPKGIAVVPGNRAIIAGTGAEEYQVIKITTESVDPPMPRCGGLNIDSGIHGLSSVSEADGDNYSYIITGDASAELKIIVGGPGGRFFDSGIFESGIFDAGSTVAFNRLDFSADIPLSTTLSLQVASALPVTDCGDANYTYVGPDGATNSYFTTDNSISFATNGNYINPGRCFRYKVYFSTTDVLYTAVFKDITVNYSP